MKIKFNKKTKKWVELEKYSKDGMYINKLLYEKIKNIRKIQKKGYDSIVIIDGDRRTGKSTLGMTMAWILSEEKLTLDNFAIGVTDCIEKIKKLPDESILFVDEGSMVFSSKDALKKELKQLIKVLDIVGMKKMMFIIVLPSFFDLLQPIATRFSRFLLHVYTDPELNRGRFGYYGKMKKKMLYSIGKKNFNSYSKPESDFTGRFTDFKVPFYDEYEKLKKQTLIEAVSDGYKKIPSELIMQIRKMVVQNSFKVIDRKTEKPKLTQVDLGKLFSVSSMQISQDMEEINGNKEEIPVFSLKRGLKVKV